MGSLALPFIYLPCAGGCLVGYALRDWRLAGAVASGGFALLILLTGDAVPLLVFVLPVLGGVAVGALVLTPLLFVRPACSVWTRMSVALVASFTAGFLQLHTATGAV